MIGFIVIFQAMYTAVMERTREIGILKSIGASKLYIVNVILRETVTAGAGRHRCWESLISLAGAGRHCAQAPHAAGRGHRRVDSEDNGDRDRRAPSSARCTPPIRAAQKDPIEALAYE